MPSFRRVFLCAVALIVVGLLAGTAVGRESAEATSLFAVVGYAEAGSTTTHQLDASRGSLTTVGIDGINVTADGSHLSAVSPETLSLLEKAHARGEKAELLVGNFDAKLGDFSPAIGDALLSSEANITAIVDALVTEVSAHGWDGVTVDLESLTDRHPAGLTRLVSKLKARLGADSSVSICLMATTDDYEDFGYDLAGLGRAADHVVLMAYDQHGPTWSKAGPVGGTPWVKTTLRPLLAAVPRAKIELGIAGYGYTWPKNAKGRQVSDALARSVVRKDGARAVWVARQHEWKAALSNGTVLWWSDARTVRSRLEYAKKLQLGGVAVWSLGLSDAIVTNR